MEGGSGGDGSAYQPYQNIPTNLSIFQQGPPLIAINRYLLSHQSQFSSQQSVNNQSIFSQCGGLCDFSSYSGISHANGISWSSVPEPSFVDRIFLSHEQNGLHWNNQENGIAEEMISSQQNSKEAGKKAKEGPSSTTVLVKGQWTEEEDRKLVKLVKQFGMRRWAQIAENMVGRAGKQCRERWHNHLRPDIKKDAWSEQEELILVEAHQQIGNKWAEIAKKIPGRTENSIKNHWNATKRRQHSRRNKFKKQEKDGQNDSKYRSNILRDYIRSKYFSDNSPPTASTPSNSISTNATPPYSDDDSPSLLTRQTYDEEMNFMQNLFGENSLVENNGKVAEAMEAKTRQCPFDNKSSSSSCPFNSLVAGYTKSDNQIVNDNSEYGYNMYMADHYSKVTQQSDSDQCSGIYLSYLLDHSTSANSLPCSGSIGYGNMNAGTLVNQGSSSSKGNKEVDLMEIVSSTLYRQQTSHTTFFN